MPPKKGKKRILSTAHKKKMREGRARARKRTQETGKECKECKTQMVQNPQERVRDWYWCPKCQRYTDYGEYVK